MKKIQLISQLALVALLGSGCGKVQTESVVEKPIVNSNLEESKNNSAQENQVASNKDEKVTSNQENQITSNQDEKVSAYQEVEVLSKKSVAMPTPSVTGKELVEKAFKSDDPYRDFKATFTQDFLDKVNAMYSVLDERYIPPYDDDDAFYLSEDSSQFGYSRRIIADDMADEYKYIKEVQNHVGFQDASDELYGWQTLTLTLCDEDKDGKIELNNDSMAILQAFYPNINQKAVQEKIDVAIQAEKEDDYEMILLELEEKYYGSVSFTWFRYEDYPVEVEISMDWYQNYPEQS